MKVMDNSLEAIVIKYSLGGMFLGSTILFVGKLIRLLWAVAEREAMQFKVWIASGDAPQQIASALWELIKQGVGM